MAVFAASEKNCSHPSVAPPKRKSITPSMPAFLFSLYWCMNRYIRRRVHGMRSMAGIFTLAASDEPRATMLALMRFARKGYVSVSPAKIGFSIGRVF